MIESQSNSYGIRCFKIVDGTGNFYQLKFEMNRKWDEIDVNELDEAVSEIIELLKEKIAEIIYDER